MAEKFKTSVGGQALMEGIMMKGPKKVCAAVRRPDGQIETKEEPCLPSKWSKIPLVRGVIGMVESLILGYRWLMYSAEISMGEDAAQEEESKLDRWLNEHLGEKAQNFIMSFAAVLGGLMALILFMILPTTIVGLLSKVVPLDGVRTLLEGILKMVMFVAYLAVVRNMKEIKRMFRYHGAEHKTIACYEAGEALTVENIRKHSRFHPRCGTSFLVLVLLVSVLLFSVLPWSSTSLRVVLKLLLLPLVMGISYELIKIAGRYNNIFTRVISAPGLWIQRLTTSEPDDSMIEIAIAAVLPVLPEKPEEGKW